MSPTPAMRAGLSEGSLAIDKEDCTLLSLKRDDGTEAPLFETLCGHGRLTYTKISKLIPLGTTKEALLRGSWILNVEIQPTCERVDVKLRNGKVLHGAKSEGLYWENTGGGGTVIEWRPSAVIVNTETPQVCPKTVRVTVDVPGDLTLEALERELRDLGARVVSVGGKE